MAATVSQRLDSSQVTAGVTAAGLGGGGGWIRVRDLGLIFSFSSYSSVSVFKGVSMVYSESNTHVIYECTYCCSVAVVLH